MPKLIIDAFEKTILEYLEKIQTTDLTKDSRTSTEIDNIIFIGLNTLIHVFRITLSKYKNTEIAYHYSKQSYIYYLEYIQQISNTEFQHDLNINDAVIFVYSKTLSNTITLEETENHQNIDLTNSTIILNNLANITNQLLLWKIRLSMAERTEIIKGFLSKYLRIFSDPEFEKHIKLMENLMVDFTHIDQINEFYKTVKKIK